MLTATLLLSSALEASAEDCQPPNGLSRCIDSNSLWLSADGSPFASISSAKIRNAEAYGVGVAGMYFSQPITLVAHSPDPDGREIQIVDDVVDVWLLASMSFEKRWQLSLSVPVAVYQSGLGIEGVTSQDSVVATETALRDPRLGGAFELFSTTRSKLELSAKSRLELSLPLGGEATFAGERGPTVAPSFVFSLERGFFFAASELGLRLRQSVPFAGARHGSQFVSAIGLGARLYSALSVAAEAWVLPVLNSQKRTLPDGTAVDAIYAPAEWLLSLRIEPPLLGGLSMLLAGGTGLPLSSERRRPPDGPVESENFAGLTSARFRSLVMLRYEPPANAP
jgi:hypothetical protein